jgi:hypothetical protein
MSDLFSARPARVGPASGRLLSRRRLLAGAVVLVGAGLGAGLGLRGTARPEQLLPAPPPRPTRLQAALDRERHLISALERATATDASLERVTTPLRSDHLAHAQTIEALLGGIATPTLSPSVTGSASVTQAPTRAALQAAERAAAEAASTDSAASAGALAALFGSIAACEAAHVQLLA